MPRCKICREKFEPKYFNQKVCYSQGCKDEYRSNKKPTQIRKVSKKREKQNKMYLELRKVHLNLHPNCERCSKPSTEIHHKNGREGERLCNNHFFMSVCRTCHQYIHDNPKESREKGWLL